MRNALLKPSMVPVWFSKQPSFFLLRVPQDAADVPVRLCSLLMWAHHITSADLSEAHCCCQSHSFNYIPKVFLLDSLSGDYGWHWTHEISLRQLLVRDMLCWKQPSEEGKLRPYGQQQCSRLWYLNNWHWEPHKVPGTHHYITTTTTTQECWHKAGWVLGFMPPMPNCGPAICEPQQISRFIR